jgi:multidrug resistance efflux pump
MSSSACLTSLLLGALTAAAADVKPAGADRALEAKPDEVVLETKGYVVPIAAVLVAPRVSGQVTELSIEEGRRVEKGAVLARLDATPYEIDYKRAQSRVRAARARLEELQAGSSDGEKLKADSDLRRAQVELGAAKAQVARLRQLQNGDAVPAGTVDKAEYQLQQAQREFEKVEAACKLVHKGPRKERLEVARAELAAEEAESEKAKYRLDATLVPAPISGTVLAMKAGVGSLVNPASFNGPSAICEMADLTQLEVELAVPERDVRRIARGQKCEVRLEAYPDTVYKGHVSRLLPVADRAKGAVPVRVRIEVSRDDAKLRPELSAVVTILGKK